MAQAEELSPDYREGVHGRGSICSEMLGFREGSQRSWLPRVLPEEAAATSWSLMEGKEGRGSVGLFFVNMRDTDLASDTYFFEIVPHLVFRVLDGKSCRKQAKHT